MPFLGSDYNGLPATFHNYSARTKTWATGGQVASADLNAIQDGLITVSATVETLAEYVAPSRTCSKNDGDTGADATGGGTCWVLAETNATNGLTEILLDNVIDWRDRLIHVVGWVDLAANIQFPGETGDNNESADTDDTTIPKQWFEGMFYSEQGGTAAGPSVMQAVGSTPSEIPAIYVNTSGELCLAMQSWSSAQARIIAKVDWSPNQREY